MPALDRKWFSAILHLIYKTIFDMIFMRRSHRLSTRAVRVHPSRIRRLGECLKVTLSPENIAKASAGAGVGLFGAAVPVGLAVSPLLGMCFVYLGIPPAVYGLLGIRLQDVQRMDAKQRKKYIDRKVKEYLDEQERRSLKAKRTREAKK